MRIYATADGGSRVEELTISPDAKPIDITRMTASVYRGSGARAPHWHTAPRKQLAINMTGELEVELTVHAAKDRQRPRPQSCRSSAHIYAAESLSIA